MDARACVAAGGGEVVSPRQSQGGTECVSPQVKSVEWLGCVECLRCAEVCGLWLRHGLMEGQL